jgi:hypothetical protein
MSIWKKTATRTTTPERNYVKNEYEKQITLLKEENKALRKKYRSMYEFCLSIIKLSQSISRLGELSK